MAAAASAVTTPFGSVYTQAMGPKKGRDTEGIASYHFDSEADCYISYEHAPPFWTCGDGSRPPAKKPIKNVSFEAATRTFRGEVEWNPTFCGDSFWKYEMVFSEDFATIASGKLDSGDGNPTEFGTGKHLQYSRLSCDLSDEESEAEKQYLAVFDALATNGALKPKEFAVVMQMEIVQNLKKFLAMGEQIAKMGALPIPPPMVDEVMPLLTRAINKMDTSHLRKFLELLFKVLDGNKNGQIERDEFKAIWDIGSSMDPARIADLLFRMVDLNDNGKISCDEAQTLLTCIAEIVSTVVASVADILDTVARSPEVTKIVVKTAQQMGVVPEGVPITTRATVEEQVTAMAPMIKAQMEATPSEQTKQMVDLVKMMRDSMARFEENVGARFYMAAMEFSQGGVDEPTFIAKVVPIVLQNQKDELAKHGNDPLKLMESYPAMTAALAKYPEPMKKAIQELKNSEELKPALLRGWERSQEYYPEMVRAMFRLLDLDDSGTISTQEITLLRAVMDAMIHLGQRAVADPNDPGQMLEGSFEDNMKALALAGFDAIDRNGDGELNLEELVKFGQKYISFILEVMVGYSHLMIECVFDEVGKVLVSHGFKNGGIEEMEKEQIMGMVQMVPMLAMQAPMMLAQMQAGA
jgi:Ca2+-binding EF-hand superfamily protein